MNNPMRKIFLLLMAVLIGWLAAPAAAGPAHRTPCLAPSLMRSRHSRRNSCSWRQLSDPVSSRFMIFMQQPVLPNDRPESPTSPNRLAPTN